MFDLKIRIEAGMKEIIPEVFGRKGGGQLLGFFRRINNNTNGMLSLSILSLPIAS